MTIKRKRKRARAPRGYMTVLGGYRLDMDNHGHLVDETMPDRIPGKDYGADPIGDGTFRMVPSGDVVTFEERNRRLAR